MKGRISGIGHTDLYSEVTVQVADSKQLAGFKHGDDVEVAKRRRIRFRQELRALPPKSVVLDKAGDFMMKARNGQWWMFAIDEEFATEDIGLPATLIQEGNEA